MVKFFIFLFFPIYGGLIGDSLYCYDPIRGNSFRTDHEDKEVVGGIVEGSDAKIDTWKWIVKIDLGCGGSIIHPNWLITVTDNISP
jgi:hypothetical protein